MKKMISSVYRFLVNEKGAKCRALCSSSGVTQEVLETDCLWLAC